MATLILNYDNRNALIKSILRSAILAGATEVATKKKSPLDAALEDVRLGRVSTVCFPKNGKKIKALEEFEYCNSFGFYGQT